MSYGGANDWSFDVVPYLWVPGYTGTCATLGYPYLHVDYDKDYFLMNANVRGCSREDQGCACRRYYRRDL